MGLVPTFNTERLIVRAVTLEDEASYAKHFVDYDVVRNLSRKIPWPYPENGVREYLAEVVIPNQGKDRWSWGIFLKEDPNELIGCIDLFRKGLTENRGFWLGKQYWGQGFMTEAVRPTLDYAFTELDFDKLIFANAVENSSSRRIKEKTGCRYLRTVPGKFVDLALTEQEQWELTKEDWIKFRS